jgi:hypothetical protein
MGGMSGRGGATGREVALVVLLGGGLGGAAWLLVLLASARAPIALCLVLGPALVASWRLAVAVVPPPEPLVPDSGEPAAEEGGFASLSTLEYRLSWSSVDRGRYEERLRPQLVRLAEERVRQRHGVDPATQPDLARRILGEPLWLLMTAPPTSGPPPSPSRLAELLSQIERI